MSFAAWLKEHIKQNMLRSGESMNRRTFLLKEVSGTDRMTLRVDNVPETAAVMRFDEGERRQLFESERGYDFLKRCDFLILDESDVEYSAILIELKRSFEDEEGDRRCKKRGERQLRWSLPSLKYLLDVFETDTRVTDRKKKLVAKYFLVAKDPDRRRRKRRSREHFISGEHEGILIHYTSKDKIKIEQLKSRTSLPVLPKL